MGNFSPSYSVLRHISRKKNTHSRLEFPGGLLRVFYLTSTSDPTSPISVVYLDLDKPSEAGSTFLAVDSLVETDVKIDGPSVEYKLDLGRPDGKGESRCKLFKGRSSAR